MTTSRSTPVVKVKTQADIIGVIPTRLGFHPSESLVIVCLDGPRQRFGLVLRLDLPEPADEVRAAADLAARAARSGADGAIVLCFTSAPDDDGELPRARLIDRVLAELDDHGLGYGESLLVREGRWWSYQCVKPCCPRGGTPLPSQPTPAVAEAEAIGAIHGRAVLPSREALVKSVAGPVALREIAMTQRQAEAEDAYIRDVGEHGYHAARLTTAGLAQTMVAGFLAGDHSVDDAQVARLLVGLTDKPARDLMYTWGLDDEHAEQVIAFLISLTQCAVGWYAVPICTVLAGVAYQQGNGALAAVAVERALRTDPTYELAQIVDALLTGQVPPEAIRDMSRRSIADLRDRGLIDDLPEAA
jgi:hypothetical protein